MDKTTLNKLLEAYPAREMTDIEGNATGIVITVPCRVQWPHLVEPQKTKRDDGTETSEYSIALLFPIGADLSLLDKVAKKKAVDVFKMPKAKTVRLPLRQQAEKTEYEGFEDGGMWLTASTQMNNFGPFGSADVGGKVPRINASEVYAGCWVLAKLSAYDYDFKGNAGVKFGLRGLQKIADDEVLNTSKVDASDGFAPLTGSPKANGAVTGANDLAGWD